jgi:hypothetical protein
MRRLIKQLLCLLHVAAASAATTAHAALLKLRKFITVAGGIAPHHGLLTY